MKLPRDLSGAELIKRLERLGYKRARQKGSHVTLEIVIDGRSHTLTAIITKATTTKTLSNIVKAVANHLSIEKSEIKRILFG